MIDEPNEDARDDGGDAARDQTPHDGLQLVAVVAVLVREGRVLSMRRAAAKGAAGGGRWETLSGRVRPMEDPRAAACREILEESGLRVGEEVWLAALPFDLYVARRVDTPMTVLVYRGEVAPGAEPRCSEEHDALAWLTADELAARPTFERLVEAVRAALRES